MDTTQEPLNSFSWIRYRWEIGYTRPEYRGTTEITIEAHRDKPAKIIVKRMHFKSPWQKSRLITKEELLHLRHAFASSTLQLNDMPGVVCDGSTDGLSILGHDGWAFELGGYCISRTQNMQAFFDALGALSEPLLDTLNQKIKDKLVAEGNYDEFYG